MKILSCGAGMQSSALHLMSCENALAKIRGEPPVWPQVPIYDIWKKALQLQILL